MRLGWLLALGVLVGGAGPAVDPDWPCMQRLVPRLTAELLWPGHAATGDWRRDPVVAGLVGEVMARGRHEDEAVGLLDRFVATKPGAEALAEVFAGLVEEANAERGHAIERLREIARRQRMLADSASRLAGELSALPTAASEEQREDLRSRRALVIREYEEVGRTLRYSCEVPVEYEARLGRFAQALQRGGAG